MPTTNGREQVFNEGIKNNDARPADTTADFLVTVNADGTYGKIDPDDLPISTDTQTALDLKPDIAKQYYSSKLAKWFIKLQNSPSTATLAYVGDSTSDLSGNATLITGFMQAQAKAGFPLEGFNTANMPNYGSNGQTITGFIGDAGSKGLAAVAAANLDLVIFSFGINDIRQNLLTKDQLKAHIITCINTIKAGSPNTDIILRMPNSFDIPTDQTYIQQGSYGSLALAAQGQSTILFDAYKELENYWDNVVLFNSQELIFGKTSQNKITALHTDEIHPKYGEIVDVLANNFIGFVKPFRSKQADAVILATPATPWNVYPRSFESSSDFIKLGEGTLENQGVGFLRTATTKNEAYNIVSKFKYLDYISINKGEMVLTSTGSNLTAGNDSRVDYSGTIPANTFAVGTKIEFFRSIYNNTLLNKRYIKDKRTYPYRRRVRLGGCGNGYIRIDSMLDDDITTPATVGLTAASLNISTSDLLVLNGATVATSLSSATFSVFSTTQKQITLTGDFTAYTGTIAFIYGTRGYEDVIVSSPVASASGYEIITRNTTTGDREKIVSTTFQPTITATTSADYYRGDKTFQPLNKAAVGLSNVDNTSDSTKFTNTPLTGIPTAPTATAGTNTIQLATTAFVKTAIDTDVSIQKIVDNSDKDATIENSEITILGGTTDNRTFSVLTSNSSGSQTGTIIINNSYSQIIGNYEGAIASFRTELGVATISQNISGGTASLRVDPTLTHGDYLFSVAVTYTDATTSAKSSSTLDTDYPLARPGDKVHCMDIIAGALIYEKTVSGWCQSPVTIVT